MCCLLSLGTQSSPFQFTLKSPVCHHPLNVFVRSCKILRLMLFGTNIAINIDIPCNANIILIMLLVGSSGLSSSSLFVSLALPCSLVLRNLKSYRSHHKREREIKPGLYSSVIWYVLEWSFSKQSWMGFLFDQGRAWWIFNC